MFLYHFNINSEASTNSHKTASGLGHAVRCSELSKQFSVEPVFCVNENSSSIAFCEDLGCNYIFEKKLDEFLTVSSPSLIVSDINYIDEKFITLYQNYKLPVVCLAPRGKFKYHSTLSFCDVEDPSEFNQEYNPRKGLRVGFDYAFVRTDIFDLRKREDIKKSKNQIVVSMGGTDTFDMTSKVVKYLQRLPSHFNVKIILGKLYQHPDLLEKLCRVHLSCNYEVLISPEHFPELLSKSSFGIFGTGIVTYEAMCLGVIPFNFGISDFHTLKGSLIEEKGAGFYVGDLRKSDLLIDFIEKIQEIYKNDELASSIRNNAMNLIDGDSQSRIIAAIKKEIINPYNLQS